MSSSVNTITLNLVLCKTQKIETENNWKGRTYCTVHKYKALYSNLPDRQTDRPIDG